MYPLKRIVIAFALVGTVALPLTLHAQDTETDLGHALMSLDGSEQESAEAATGWHTCNVVRTGAGWGNHYVAITCTTGPFTNKWHIMESAQEDAMLATALAAAASNNKVQVNILAMSSGYNKIRALYLSK